VETKKGKVVACLFKEGDAWKWFRARVEGRAKTEAGAPASTSDGLELHEVTFIDYGNKDTVTVQRLRPLDASIAGIPPLARECGLAYVRVPSLSAEYGNEAAGLLSDMAYGRRMLIKTHGREGVGPSAKQLVSLWNPEKPGEECVNVALVEEGLGRISRTEARRVERRLGGVGGLAAAAAGGDKDADLLQRLRAAVEVAKKARAGLFMYGDAGDSEDERR
jgi:staphylococcal nuclease domain-containing protein 1